MSGDSYYDDNGMENRTLHNNDSGLTPAEVVTLSFFIPLIVTVMVPLLVIGICLCFKYSFPSQYTRMKVALLTPSPRECNNVDTSDSDRQNTIYSNRCTLDPEIAITESKNSEIVTANASKQGTFNKHCTDDISATTVLYTNTCVDDEGFEDPAEILRYKDDRFAAKPNSYVHEKDVYNRPQTDYAITPNHSQQHSMKFALSSVIIEEENEENEEKKNSPTIVSEEFCKSLRINVTPEKHCKSDRDMANDESPTEERYDSDSTPVSALVSPKFSGSRWEFTEIDSPTSKPSPFPPEYGPATSSGHEGRLSDSFSASQVSFDQPNTSLDTTYQRYVSNYYGCLPDQRYAYSASQISTVGSGSQVGMFQDYMQDASQRSVHVDKKKSHGKRQEKNSKLALVDTKSGDSGIGPSLSGGKSLTPGRHGISLTQAPPEMRLGKYETHISMDHTIAVKLNRHWSSSDVRSRTVDQKQKKREAKMSYTKRHHHTSHYGNCTLPRSFKEQVNAWGTKTPKEKLSKLTSKHETASQMEEEEERSMETQSKTKSNLEDCIISPIRSQSHSTQQPPCKEVPLIVPECMQPTATLENCTSDGLEYRDPTNGFVLSIGEGAIAEGDRLTIDIGVSMYGPFKYPEGTRRVSPVFWMCVRENSSYKFKKPIKILIQHFLTVKSDGERTAMALSFAKASHRQNHQKEHSFYKVQDIQGFKPRTRYGTILTSHFCYQCIVAKISELTIRNTNFCLFGTVPITFAYDRTMYVFFYVTFFLDKCLDTVRRQIAASDELSHCEYSETKVQFQFAEGTSRDDDGGTPSIAIHLPQSLPGGWKLGLEFKKKIRFEDVDFLARSRDHLHFMENEGLYPPYFRLSINGTHTVEKATAHLTFSGTQSDLVFDIHLVPPTLSKGPHSTSQAALHMLPATNTLPPLKLNQLVNLVISKIPGQWRWFGIEIEVPEAENNFETYPVHNVKECFIRVVMSWKKRGYPKYTWETVLKTLQSESLSEKRLAMEVQSQLLKSSRDFQTVSFSQEPTLSCPAPFDY